MAEQDRGVLNPNRFTRAGVSIAEANCTAPTIIADTLGEEEPVFINIVCA